MRKPFSQYGSDSEQDSVTPVVSEVRDELNNIRNLTIKTEHQLKLVSNEVKAVANFRVQSRLSRFLSSGIAYLLFSFMIGAGAWLYVQAKLETGRKQGALFEQKERSYQREAAELRGQLGQWRQIERELLEFENLVNKGRKEEAVEKFAALINVRFRGLLETLVASYRKEVAAEKYKQGRILFEKGSFDRADALLVKSLEFDPKPKYFGNLLYYQGMSGLRLKDFSRAARLLRRALEHRMDRRLVADARYHLAYAHDKMGERRTAKNLYFRFYNTYQKHRFHKRAKQRFKRLKKKR